MEESHRAVTPLPHVFNMNEFEDKPMPIYLAPEEQHLLDQVIYQGDYVAVHPFAGEQNRSFAERLPDFIDSLVERGLKVVVIGGSYINNKTNLSEEYNYSPRGVVNLVNIAGVRLSCELVHHAKYFIGSHSCYQMAAWYYRIPSFCLLPDSFVSRMIPDPDIPGVVFHGYDPYVTHLFHPGNKLMFFSEFPHIQRFLNEFIGDKHGIQHGTGVANEDGCQTTSPRPRKRLGPCPMFVAKRRL
jgi:ADP-heptose:LPS heptosyltransferase